MWNDTEEPLAFLISFRTYGTWLHGDERGSIDRFNNIYGEPLYPPDRARRELTTGLMRGSPVRLDSVRRSAVQNAIVEVCRFRGWCLLASNVRTNHVHAVVANPGIHPKRILNAFKSYATRKMRKTGCWNETHSPWSDKGSKRRLWNTGSVERAIDYVTNCQGDELPDWL